MDGKQNKGGNWLKIVIVVLAVLLAGCSSEPQPGSAIQPDAVIAAEEVETGAVSENRGVVAVLLENAAGAEETVASTQAGEAAGENTASAVWLHSRNPDDNTPFQVANMFPGDAETKYYRVRVSHNGDVTLRFHADIRPGGEKLAEVLKCRVVLPETGELLYDGLMRDMPQSLNHALHTTASTTSEVSYEITAYLDTSVGNEYMNLDLTADFRWWVEETENLESPKTGDSFRIVFWAVLAAGSLFLLILLWRKREKEAAADGR